MSVVEFALGILYGSFLEWWVHKKLFHEYGKKKGSRFSFHIHQHHSDCVKNNYFDDQFSTRETFGLLLIGLIHIPILYESYEVYFGLALYALAFHILHNKGHKDPEWARKYQPWHWRHHMEKPNANWNVVLPIADWIMRTNK